MPFVPVKKTHCFFLLLYLTAGYFPINCFFSNIYEIGINSRLCHQLLMCTALGNSAIRNNNNLLCISDRFQPMSNNNNRFILCQLLNGLLEFCLVFRVYTACCFIQNYDRGTVIISSCISDTSFSSIVSILLSVRSNSQPMRTFCFIQISLTF